MQLENALSLIATNPSGRLSSFSPEPQNACMPISVTEEGMEILVKPVQFLNRYDGIFFSPFANEIFASAVQPLKIGLLVLPELVNVAGILTLLSDVQLENAWPSIVVTP